MMREFDVDGNNHDALLVSNERAYLQEIGRIPLLTAGEEVSLGRAIRRGLDIVRPTIRASGQQVQTLDGCNPTTYPLEETIILEEAIKARIHLAESNLRLVVSVAKKYLGRGMSFLDLVQEGNLGLIRAVEKFEWQKGYRFSTYATWWIRQGVIRGIADQARTVRVPVHVTDDSHKIAKAEQLLRQESFTEAPTATAVAMVLGGKFTPSKVEDIRQHLSPIASLDYQKEGSPQFVLGDTIEDPSEPVEATAAQSVLKNEVDKVLNCLTARERLVLMLRYGLEDGRDRTLEEVGRELGVTRERIRQIEEKAFKRLRHPSRSKRLKDHLNQ